MQNKKIFPIIFCCMLTVTHITAMEEATSPDNRLSLSSSPRRGRKQSRELDEQERELRARSASSSLETLTSSAQLSPRKSANSSESAPNSPRQQQADEIRKVETTPGNYLNSEYIISQRPGYISTFSKQDIPLFKATKIEFVFDKIYKITYIDAGNQSIYLMDADKKSQSIHIHADMHPLHYSYWIKEGDNTFCIELSPPKIVTDKPDITPESKSSKRSDSKKPATICTPKMGLSFLVVFIIAMLYRDNRLPDLSYYILAFNALLKGFGAKP